MNDIQQLIADLRSSRALQVYMVLALLVSVVADAGLVIMWLGL